MLYKGDKEIVTIYYGRQAIAEIRKGAMLVWAAIRSCFGRGFWVNDKQYSNKDPWRNNL